MKRRACFLGVLVVLCTTPVTYAANQDPATVTSSYAWKDPRIDESSDLLDDGAVNLTTNDSGDGPFVYVVDARTGATVGRTNFRAHVVDVEALSPAGPSSVWVGDIGDNLHRRRTVAVYRVPFAHRSLVMRARGYRLAYPDGPHDAESMVTGPDGRLYLITKSLLGGGVYAAPRHLDPAHVNRLTRVGKVRDFATDAASFPDHRHVIVRSYGAATVYTFPAFRQVDWFRLPAQRQGEGISVGPGHRIRLSSEGVHSRVLQIAIPRPVRVAMGFAAPATITPSPTPSPIPSPTPAPTPSAKPGPSTAAGSDPGSDDPGWLLWAVPSVLALGALTIGLGLRRRPPS